MISAVIQHSHDFQQAPRASDALEQDACMRDTTGPFVSVLPVCQVLCLPVLRPSSIRSSTPIHPPTHLGAVVLVVRPQPESWRLAADNQHAACCRRLGLQLHRGARCVGQPGPGARVGARWQLAGPHSCGRIICCDVNGSSWSQGHGN
jgi:hypothetical protein